MKTANPDNKPPQMWPTVTAQGCKMRHKVYGKK